MMTTVLKRVLGLLGILMLLCALSFTAIITLVDPNQFKVPLQNYVFKETARSLTIKGPLHWHMNPFLSLEASDLHLGNPSTFTEDFLVIEKASIKAHFWPLFLAKVVFDLELKGPALNLEREGTEHNNWQDLFLHWHPKTLGHIFSTHVLLNGLRVEEGKINWRDNLNNENYLITHLTADAQKLFLGPMDTLTPLSCHFTVQDVHGSDLGSFDLHAEWQFQPKFNRIHLEHIHIKTQYRDNPASVLSADMMISHSSTRPLIKGKIDITDLDLTPLFIALGKQPHPVKIPDFKTQFSMQGSVLALRPIEFHMGQGHHQGTLEIDFREKPKVSLHHQGDDFEMNDILGLMGYADTLNGRSHIKTRLRATGETVAELLHSLSGDIELQISDGKWTGMDLVSLLQKTRGSVQTVAEAFAKKETINLASSLRQALEAWAHQATHSHLLSTPFSSTKASLHFHEGIMHNNDFAMSHPEYRLEGRGTLDFVNNDIKYQVSAWSNAPLALSTNWAKLLTETALPIYIRGPFSNPELQPNFASYTQEILQAAKLQAPKAEKTKTDTPAKSEKTDKFDKLIEEGITRAFGF